MSSTTELEVLFPTGKEVTVAGEVLRITPFKAGQLPRVFKAVDPISAYIYQAFTNNIEGNAATVITSIMAQGGDNVLELASIGARKPRAWVDDLELDELIAVVSAVLEVNVSFFVQKVLPTITNSLAKVAQVSGQTSS